MQQFGWICCYCKCFRCFNNNSKALTTNDRLMKLYNEGVDRFETELGIEKILKHLRDLRILTKMRMSLKDEFVVQHNRRNVIDVEGDAIDKSNQSDYINHLYNSNDNIDFPR